MLKTASFAPTCHGKENYEKVLQLATGIIPGIDLLDYCDLIPKSPLVDIEGIFPAPQYLPVSTSIPPTPFPLSPPSTPPTLTPKPLMSDINC